MKKGPQLETLILFKVQGTGMDKAVGESNKNNVKGAFVRDL